MPDDHRPTLSPKPGRSPSNRSLQRGVEILRAFRPGSGVLGNGELAERTGLARPTVTRLTQTLVGMGLLEQQPARQGYRLAPAVLSLAHAMRSASPVLAIAAPLMRALAQDRQINVGLAAADGDEMVYLESIRYSRRASFRTVVSGQRVPIELTSLGCAWLASTTDAQRTAVLASIRRRRRRQWPALGREIQSAIDSVRRAGFCAASWQPEVVALAAPLPTAEGVYALNVSASTTESIDEMVGRLAAPLLALRTRILAAIDVEGLPDAIP